MTASVEEKRIDFSAVVPWMPLPWSGNETTFRAKLDWQIAYYANRLASEDIPMTEQQVSDLTEAAIAYRGKILAAMKERSK